MTVDRFVISHRVLDISISHDSYHTLYAALVECVALNGDWPIATGVLGSKSTFSLRRHAEDQIELIGSNFSVVAAFIQLKNSPWTVPVDTAVAATLLSEMATAADNIGTLDAPASVLQQVYRELTHVAALIDDTENDHDAEIVEVVSRLATTHPGFERAVEAAARLSRRATA